MSTVYVDGYKSALSVRETDKAIRFIKDTFHFGTAVFEKRQRVKRRFERRRAQSAF